LVRYSFNQKAKDVVFASMSDINASSKDLGAVCDAIRYKSVQSALDMLESVANGDTPILYRKHNTHMGSRHELHGNKGRYPKKCASFVRKVLVNAKANASSKGLVSDDLYVVHAAANKTVIIPRYPSKGIISIGHGYGYGATRHSDLELARIEIAVAGPDTQGLSKNVYACVNASKARASRAKPKATTPAKKAQAKKVPAKEAKAIPAAEKPKKEDAKAQVQSPAPAANTETEKKEGA
jgi:ribosomal protein uL22